jgi:hypothetical protein
MTLIEALLGMFLTIERFTMNRSITRQDIETLWNALAFYREEGIPESANDKQWDDEWSDICTLMAWISEDYGLAEEVDHE